jgi:hypothetical protein
MIDNNKANTTKVVLNETGLDNCNETKKSQSDDNSSGRSFGVTDLWGIRRKARAFKIHNRIPRL